jgi:hypothetical protein
VSFDPKIIVEDLKTEQDFINFVNNNITYKDPLDIVCDVRCCSLDDIVKKYIIITQESNLIRVLIAVYDEYFLAKAYKESELALEECHMVYDNFKLLNNTRCWLLEIQGNIGTALLFLDEFVLSDKLHTNSRNDSENIYR